MKRWQLGGEAGHRKYAFPECAAELIEPRSQEWNKQAWGPARSVALCLYHIGQLTTQAVWLTMSYILCGKYTQRQCSKYMVVRLKIKDLLNLIYIFFTHWQAGVLIAGLSSFVVCLCHRYAITVWYFDAKERAKAKEKYKLGEF